MPKIFRLTKAGKLDEAIFKGSTINTPSMLCVEDHLDALDWSREIGGLEALIARSNANFAVIADWVAASDWAQFLAADPAQRSTTSVCLVIADPWFESLSGDEQAAAPRPSPAGSIRKGWRLMWGPIVTHPLACGSGPVPRWKPLISRPLCPGSTGPSRPSRQTIIPRKLVGVVLVVPSVPLNPAELRKDSQCPKY